MLSAILVALAIPKHDWQQEKPSLQHAGEAHLRAVAGLPEAPRRATSKELLAHIGTLRRGQDRALLSDLEALKVDKLASSLGEFEKLLAGAISEADYSRRSRPLQRPTRG